MLKGGYLSLRGLDTLKGHLEMVVKRKCLSLALTWWWLPWSPMKVAGRQPWPTMHARSKARLSDRAV